MLTGRGADVIVIDDPLKPEEALSETRRAAANDGSIHRSISASTTRPRAPSSSSCSACTRTTSTGHVLAAGTLGGRSSSPRIAEQDEEHAVATPLGPRRLSAARAGEALHPEREPLPVLERLRATLGPHHFAGQYQQPRPRLGGGMVKAEWFRSYPPETLPARFERILQSWDTANKPTDLSDYSVCTTWGIEDRHLYLLHVLRERLDYPSLKRAVRDQAALHRAEIVLIEDKASGAQLIQELIAEGLHAVTAYAPLARQGHAPARANLHDRERLRPSPGRCPLARRLPPRTHHVPQGTPRRPGGLDRPGAGLGEARPRRREGLAGVL